ncbi:MAG: Thiamine-monophosphate kinase [Alphaproteobacteria bacterium MarineAlpha9_Bin4]|nr:thiamine-phosphate kinase [Pelagibacterales bacterium]PPR25948.1 MAG: Thiamine-monophosphate kinase [Alphaproteobacteria bacterium MarineAlpha9_Bin4]
MKEINLIKKYFLPFSKNFKDSLNLEDDAAVLSYFKNEKYLVSVDNFIQGIHCPHTLNSKQITVRAILCAISDLAAMGATPYCIFLSLSIPKMKSKNIFNNIAKGIDEVIHLTGIKIAGGDLVSYDGPLAISVTAVGKKKSSEKTLFRKGGKVGDFIGITGFIGDAYIGLKILQKKITISNVKEKKSAINSFLYPPQLHDFAKKLSDYAHCCIDISDGLIEDIGKLGALANCGVELFSNHIPLSNKANLLIKDRKVFFKDILKAGDDYQLAFTFHKKNLGEIQKLKGTFNLNISIVGQLTNGKGVYLDKKKISGGFSHF